ncbi:MAG TPA: hypothetical protein VF901_11015, partial [Bradyrhizobium sp.]
AVFHEVHDEIEDLRLHGNGNLLAAQLAPVGIEKVIPEQKLHVENSGLTTTSGNDEIKMDFDLKSVSLPGGPPGSQQPRDGCHAVCGGGMQPELECGDFGQIVAGCVLNLMSPSDQLSPSP